MPFFEKSNNIKTKNGTFVDGATTVNIHNETHGERQYRGIDRLLAASIPQALHDSSENNKPACFEGTREEHIRNITGWGLGDWKARQAHVLWLEGPAGVGKSAVAQSCARSIGGRLGATFFFSRTNGWNDPKAFVPTIAYQLATKYPPYRDRVDAIVLRDPLVLEKLIEAQFHDLLVQPLRELKDVGIGVGEDAIIIVDGLDECDGVGAQRTIIEIIITSVREQTTPFLWAFFSRPEPHIMAAFSSKQATDVCLKLNLPVSRDADGDIEAYLRDGFRMIRAKYNFPAVFIWPSEEEIHQLVDQSAGLFVYTASAIRYMENPSASEPTSRLRSLLELGNTKTSDNPLANLDRFYSLILEQVPEGILPNTLLLLSALNNVALRSLSAQSLCTILEFSLAKFYSAVINLHSVLNIATSDNGVPGTLSFYHASFSDFLKDEARSTPRFFVENGGLCNQVDFQCADALRRISHTTYDNEGTWLY
ncbi:hypothetical protein P691DRAFT_803398 [Macrolepiota fuliginosa MF-IS2]|uniref:Nephrocystin 3-like N-terminal domain-containing protein n=1 Tax=Macrolepiota fuliginosa MF-IS2 TaxID=1400762 RepID=A0A9P6BV15_9AGAR|nr:hypothetical protein P691DRAFT_803398 [Macrolepiota fuliginosa MF-IS2]